MIKVINASYVKLPYIINQSNIKEYISQNMINSPLHSKAHRSDAELQEAHKKLKAIKYPVPALSHAMYLSKKMKSMDP